MDFDFFKIINGLSGGSFADGFFKVLANDLPAVLVVAVALVFFIPWSRNRRERRSGAVLATASAALALLAAQPLAHLVDRARPYVTHPSDANLLIGRSHDPSFPSDHAAGAFALAFGIWMYDRTLGTVLLVLAALLAFARVYVGTHYPGDVLGGAVLGVAVVIALFVVPTTRKLIEWVAAQCGEIWETVLARFRTSSRGPSSDGPE